MDKKRPQAGNMRRTFPDPVRADPIVSGLMGLEDELLKIVNEIAVIRRERADAILEAYQKEKSGSSKTSDSAT